jgi:hypothetical protein
MKEKESFFKSISGHPKVEKDQNYNETPEGELRGKSGRHRAEIVYNNFSCSGNHCEPTSVAEPKVGSSI